MSLDASLKLIVPTSEISKAFKAIGKLCERKDLPAQQKLSIKLPDGKKVIVPVTAVPDEAPYVLQRGDDNASFNTTIWCRYDKPFASYCDQYGLELPVETQGRSKVVAIDFDVSCSCYSEHSIISFLATDDDLGMALMSPEINTIRGCFAPVLKAVDGVVAMVSAEGTDQLLDAGLGLDELIDVNFEDFFDRNTGSFDRERWMAEVLKKCRRAEPTNARSPMGELCFFEQWKLDPAQSEAGIFSGARLRLWQAALRLGLDTTTFGDGENSIIARVPEGLDHWADARNEEMAKLCIWIAGHTECNPDSNIDFSGALLKAFVGDGTELEAIEQAEESDLQLMELVTSFVPDVEALLPRLVEGGVPQWDWNNAVSLAEIEALPEHILSDRRKSAANRDLKDRDEHWVKTRSKAIELARSGRLGQAAFMLQATLAEIMNVTLYQPKGDWPEPDAEQWLVTLQNFRNPLADYFAAATDAACEQKNWVLACDALNWWLCVEPGAGDFTGSSAPRTCLRQHSLISAGIAKTQKEAAKNKQTDPGFAQWAAVLKHRFQPVMDL